MADDKSRSQELIFSDMHRDLRVWNSQIPESPDRLDPILRTLLQLYAHQLAGIDKRIDRVWEVASQSLIRSVCPEIKRWPVPAFTVMRCAPTDEVVELDQHTRFFYRETREGGQTFFFSSGGREKLTKAEVRNVFLLTDGVLVDLSPSPEESLTSHTRPLLKGAAGSVSRIYISVDYSGPPSDFTDVTLFLNGHADALKQLRWARWYPSGAGGQFYEDSGFCPGLTCSIEDILSGDDSAADWGGMRSSSDLFQTLENNLIKIPEKFALTWQMGPPDKNLLKSAKAAGVNLAENEGNLYWIRIDLPQGGDKSSFLSAFRPYFNCFVAFNKNELTLFKHTGGNRLIEIEIPEDISGILEITEVVDSNGRSYGARHEMTADRSQHYYSLEERGNKLVLWFDFSLGIELPPDSITVNYTVTSGPDANGIEAGKINELYESHPGIASVENIIPTRGAIPSKTRQQILTEVAARLRNRDRALSFAEIAEWATTFDPRILNAMCEKGIQRGERGIRRCVVVKLNINKSQFYSDDEIALLQTRLNAFLRARAPVNTHFKVEILEK
jgi:hypothetical protein